MADYTVSYNELNSLLQSLPTNTRETYYRINVTGLTQANLLGAQGGVGTPSPLGQIIKNRGKFIYLDLGEESYSEEITSFYYAFININYLIGINGIPSSVTTMNYCFNGCTSFNQPITIPSSVTNMEWCFNGCTSFNQPITIPSSVTTMERCFNGCTSFNQPITIPSSVTTMEWCFYDCTSFNQPITIPSSVTTMERCFNGCTSFNQPITIPSSVTNMNYCFYGCTYYSAIISIPITNYSLIFNAGFSSSYRYKLNITELTNEHTKGTSTQCSALGTVSKNTSVDLYETQESYINVTDMSYCFNGCTSFNQTLELPETLTDMSYCFNGCTSFNQTLELPETLTDMSYCFNGCTSFNQNIVIPLSINNLSSSFYNCSALEEITFTNEDTEQLTSLLNNSPNCFYGCTSFIKINVKLPKAPEIRNNWIGYYLKSNAEDENLVDIKIYDKQANTIRETSVPYSKNLKIEGLINNIVFDVDNSTIPEENITTSIQNRITLSKRQTQGRFNYNEKNFILWGESPDSLVTNMNFGGGSGQLSIPVGFIYVQYPNQLEPDILFGEGTWEDISEIYENAFFRVAGNKSQSFENQVQIIDGKEVGIPQEEQVPDVTGKFTVSYSSKIPTGMYKRVSSGLLSHTGGAYVGTEYESHLSWGNSKYVENGEVRPLNYTVRIWKRTQ